MVRRGDWRAARERVMGVVAVCSALVLFFSCSSCAPVHWAVRNNAAEVRSWFPPALPDGTAVLRGGELYRELWREVEACSGRTYSIRKIKFYAVPNAIPTVPGFTYRGVSGLAGYAEREHGRILVGLPWVTDARVVRHEMLHVIASPTGHDPRFFGAYADGKLVTLGKCAEIVSCGPLCQGLKEEPVSK